MVENKFVGKGRMDILARAERFLPGPGPRSGDVALSGPILGEMYRTAGRVRQSWLELAMPIPVQIPKSKD